LLSALLGTSHLSGGEGLAADAPSQTEIAQEIRSGTVGDRQKAHLLHGLIFGSTNATPSSELVDAVVGLLASDPHLAELRHSQQESGPDDGIVLIGYAYSVFERIADPARALALLGAQFAETRNERLRCEAYTSFAVVWVARGEDRPAHGDVLIAGSFDRSESIRSAFLQIAEKPGDLFGRPETARRVFTRVGMMAMDVTESAQIRMHAGNLLDDRAQRRHALQSMLTSRDAVPIAYGAGAGHWQARTGALAALAGTDGLSFLPEVRQLLCSPGEFTLRLEGDLAEGQAQFTESDSMFYLKAAETLCLLGDPQGFAYVVPFLDHPRKPETYQCNILDGIRIRWAWPKERVEEEIAGGEHGNPEWAARVDAALDWCLAE